jgi:hypothetical protein
MNQKMVYILSLTGFFLIWGVFGFISVPPGAPGLQVTAPVVENTRVPAEGTLAAGIPVTSEPEPVWTEIVVFYGLIGVTAMFLILALLSIANKSTAPYVERKSPSSNETQKD